MACKVRPRSLDKVPLPSGKVIEGEQEVEYTKEIARAVRFGDLELVEERAVSEPEEMPEDLHEEELEESEGE